MNQKIYNKRKLMLAGAAILGGLELVIMIMIMMVQQFNTSKDYVYEENKAYLKQLEKTADKMTEEQKLKFIEDCKRSLVRLQDLIESDTLNPEERFDARRSFSLRRKEMEIMQKKLDDKR